MHVSGKHAQTTKSFRRYYKHAQTTKVLEGYSCFRDECNTLTSDSFWIILAKCPITDALSSNAISDQINL